MDDSVDKQPTLTSVESVSNNQSESPPLAKEISELKLFFKAWLERMESDNLCSAEELIKISNAFQAKLQALESGIGSIVLERENLEKAVEKIIEELLARIKKNEARFTDLQKRSEKIKNNLTIDLLTGLDTEEYFNVQLLEAVKLLQRGPGQLVLALMSIDNLDEIEEKYGTEIRNRLLKKMGEALRKNKRPGDIIARSNKTEEEVIMAFSSPHSEDRDFAKKARTRIQQILEQELVVLTDTEEKINAKISHAIGRINKNRIRQFHDPANGDRETDTSPRQISINELQETVAMHFKQAKNNSNEKPYPPQEIKRNERRVLIIDDNPGILRGLATTLSNSRFIDNYDAFQEGGSFEAKDENGYEVNFQLDTNDVFGKDQKPSIILLDADLPETSGFEILEKIKDDPQHADIPVILLCGRENRDDRIKGMQMGASACIEKPFLAHHVLSEVDRVLLEDLKQKELKQKLEEIKKAQLAILPQTEVLQQANCGLLYEPLSYAGGDVCDVLPLTDGVHGYFIGDLTGHSEGISSKVDLVIGTLRRLSKEGKNLHEIMSDLNQILTDPQTLPPEKYLTGCYLELDRNQGKVKIINSGHPPVFYVNKTGTVEILEKRGSPLGTFSDIEFEYQEMNIEKGDRLFLFTDFIFEAPDKTENKNQPWVKGIPRVKKICKNLDHNLPIEQVPKAILKAAEKVITHERDDDITILAIEV